MSRLEHLNEILKYAYAFKRMDGSESPKAISVTVSEGNRVSFTLQDGSIWHLSRPYVDEFIHYTEVA